jgi:hypothetical protein
MELVAVIERVERLACLDADTAASAAVSKYELEAGLVAARELDAWVEARRSSIVTQLATVDAFPESTIAAASKTSIGKAANITERADTLTKTPTLAEALGDGAVTAGHVDAVTRAGKQLDEHQRAALFDRVESLVDVARAGTVDEFAKRVKLEARRIEASDGMDRYERQRRNTRLSTWTDDDGMFNLRGRFDPLTGTRIAAKLDQTVETLFSETTPEHAPSDPTEKQRFLTAEALARLIDGNTGSGKPGRAEYLVVIDAGTPTGTVTDLDTELDPGELSPSQVHWPIPVEIPTRVLAALMGAPDSDVVGIVVCNGIVLHAPGALDQGRTNRIANRAQRRALRAMYSTCGIPGCSVGFDRCHIHHIVWWRHGGRTDLTNLIPLCTKHHAKIHHDNWTITLGPNRELTLTLPDSRTMTTGPPTIRAA